MAKLVYGLGQSLDGYVDHQKLGRPSPAAFDHFYERVRRSAGMIYGRSTYEIMTYWDGEEADWDAEDRAFAVAWRSKPKWVASRSSKAVGPNATPIGDNLGAAVEDLKARLDGQVDVAGPTLAHSLTELGLIDEYQLYIIPVVLGEGAPFFAGPRPPLRLSATDHITEDMVRLTYVPA